MSDRQTFRVSEVNPNPFRKIESYPFHKKKLEALRESIRNTGFWDNVVGRLNEDGEPEIAYGHHRIEAAKRELGPDAEVELILRDLSDDDMLRIMARENMEEWGTSVWVEMETVKSAVEAYAEGRIELPEVPAAARDVRDAPGFAAGGPRRQKDKPYTNVTLARFLGWTWTDSNGRTRPQEAVDIALSALEMVEAGVLEEDDLKGLSRQAAKEAIRGARRVKKRKERAASVHEQQAEQAEREAESAESEEEKQRAKRRSEAARQKAEKLRREGEEAEKQAAKSVTRKLREGEIGTKEARREADKAAGGDDRAERVVRAEDAAQSVCTSLNRLLDADRHPLAEKVEELIRLRHLLDEPDREQVAKNLDVVADRARDLAQKIREPAEADERQLVEA